VYMYFSVSVKVPFFLLFMGALRVEPGPGPGDSLDDMISLRC
jgi:hypothetical protein